LLYTIAVRGSRAGFLIVGAWNLLVLISCVPLGNHYLVDVIAGCCVAVIAWLLAKLMPGKPTNAWQTQQPRRLDA
jgi:membrane-associated phospholipid phosphatase